MSEAAKDKDTETQPPSDAVNSPADGTEASTSAPSQSTEACTEAQIQSILKAAGQNIEDEEDESSSKSLNKATYYNTSTIYDMVLKAGILAYRGNVKFTSFVNRLAGY